MQIPKKFTVFGQVVNVENVDSINNGGRYGDYNDATRTIRLARTVTINGKLVKLSQLQIETTFWHEVFHVFQCDIKGETDEWESSSYSGAIMELIRSGELRIVPNEVIKDKPIVYDD